MKSGSFRTFSAASAPLMLVCFGPLTLGATQPAVDDHFCSSSSASPVAGFSQYGGQWSVSQGVVQVGADAGPKLVCDQYELATGSVVVELRLGQQGGNAGLIVRVARAATGADAFDGYEISVDTRDQYGAFGAPSTELRAAAGRALVRAGRPVVPPARDDDRLEADGVRR